jgi:antirestriction protein ArdC
VEDEEDDTPRRIVARGFWVFNVAQVDKYEVTPPPQLPEAERIVRAEQFYARLGIDTRFRGDEAFYRPGDDYVQLPPFERFRNPPAFYATSLHEAAHATGAAHRLNRDLSGRFGSTAYAMEEMIADWASAMACMTLEITPEPRPDHAPYIASWLKVLGSDVRAVFAAASHAQRIVDWMWTRQQSIGT